MHIIHLFESYVRILKLSVGRKNSNTSVTDNTSSLVLTRQTVAIKTNGKSFFSGENDTSNNISVSFIPV